MPIKCTTSTDHSCKIWMKLHQQFLTSSVTDGQTDDREVIPMCPGYFVVSNTRKTRVLNNHNTFNNAYFLNVRKRLL